MSISDDEVEAAAKGAFAELMVMAKEVNVPFDYITTISVGNYRVMRAALSAAAKVRAIREHATSSNGVGGFGPTPTIDPVFSSDIETMTPTDNLEAGAGDLVARYALFEATLTELQAICSDFGVNGGEKRTDGIRRVLTEAAAQLAAATAENARLRDLHSWPQEAQFQYGDWVEKFTGEARWEGRVVSAYHTKRLALRYVVEVEPQGFQMIAVPAQLRAALSQEAPK